MGASEISYVRVGLYMTELHTRYVQICMFRFEHKVFVHCIRVSLEANSYLVQRATA